MKKLINWITNKAWEVIAPKVSEMVYEQMANELLNGDLISDRLSAIYPGDEMSELSGKIVRLEVLTDRHAKTIDEQGEKLDRIDERVDDIKYEVDDLPYARDIITDDNIGDYLPDASDIIDNAKDEIIDTIRDWLKELL